MFEWAFANSVKYSALSNGSQDTNHPRRDQFRTLMTKFFLNSYFILGISILVNLAFAIMFVLGAVPSEKPLDKLIYSPAQEAVSYYQHRFTLSFIEETTIYQAANDEADRAWDSLYNQVLWSKIDANAARQLVEPTSNTINMTGDPDGYIVGLDVFHQLHCLDMLRQSLYPDRYGDHNATEEKKKRDFLHLSHCVDSLRQSLQCAADISVIPFNWDEDSKADRPNLLRTVHTCRDWDKIKHWAEEHSLRKSIRL